MASGVQGLEPEKVTIVDTRGNLLTEKGGSTESLSQQYTNNLELQRQFEKKSGI